MKSIDRILVSCEHAGNRVPAAYDHLFRGSAAILSSHRGFDAGAISCARSISRFFKAPLFFCVPTRLLIDANRSPSHPKLFSEFSLPLPAAEKQRLMSKIYLPYREGVQRKIHEWVSAGHRVLHLSIHSFTPVWNGAKRNAGIGLLYDPRRAGEKNLCRRLKGELKRESGLRVRSNYPYRGVYDGFTTALRRIYDDVKYLGLEIELNQSLLGKSAKRDAAIADAFCRALDSSIASK